MRVTRQPIRQQTHVRGTARIRVVAERHVANFAVQLRPERHKLRDRRAGNFRAENDGHLRLGIERRFQLDELLDKMDSAVAPLRAPESEWPPLPGPP